MGSRNPHLVSYGGGEIGGEVRRTRGVITEGFDPPCISECCLRRLGAMQGVFSKTFGGLPSGVVVVVVNKQRGSPHVLLTAAN